MDATGLLLIILTGLGLGYYVKREKDKARRALRIIKLDQGLKALKKKKQEKLDNVKKTRSNYEEHRRNFDHHRRNLRDRND